MEQEQHCEEEEEVDPFAQLAGVVDQDEEEGEEKDSRRRRSNCVDCERPSSVCWCPFLPDPPPQVRSRVLILQHPGEAKRGVRTALMAARGIADSRCTVRIGKKFPGQDQELGEALSSPGTRLLYPGEQAKELSREDTEVETLVVLDGTWDEARKLLSRNPALSALPRVTLPPSEGKSEYVVRTQPLDCCVSTVEAVGRALSALEARPDVAEALVRPLRAMCNFQINHGAVTHDSREFREQNARFVKKNQFKRKNKNKAAIPS